MMHETKPRDKFDAYINIYCPRMFERTTRALRSAFRTFTRHILYVRSQPCVIFALGKHGTRVLACTTHAVFTCCVPFARCPPVSRVSHAGLRNMPVYRSQCLTEPGVTQRKTLTCCCYRSSDDHPRRSYIIRARNSKPVGGRFRDLTELYGHKVVRILYCGPGINGSSVGEYRCIDWNRR